MYIDPAATSYIVQVVAGVVISLGVVFGIFWKKIKLFFQKKKIEATERQLRAQAGQRDATNH